MQSLVSIKRILLSNENLINTYHLEFLYCINVLTTILSRDDPLFLFRIYPILFYRKIPILRIKNSLCVGISFQSLFRFNINERKII